MHLIDLSNWCHLVLSSVSKKFEVPIFDIRVYDDLNTEIDEEAFEFLVTKPDLGVLEVRLPKGSDPEGESLIKLDSKL